MFSCGLFLSRGKQEKNEFMRKIFKIMQHITFKDIKFMKVISLKISALKLSRDKIPK